MTSVSFLMICGIISLLCLFASYALASLIVAIISRVQLMKARKKSRSMWKH